MSRFCLSSIVLLVLALSVCEGLGRRSHGKSQPTAKGFSHPLATDPFFTCAAYGKCCDYNDQDCGPDRNGDYCNCDLGCKSWNDCCADYVDFCHQCEFPFVNVQGKCFHYAGQFGYYDARKQCESFDATILMPQTQADWDNFRLSGFYDDVTAKDPSFEFWLNCIMIGNTWYWRVPGAARTDVPVTWNDFPIHPPVAKTAGLIGMAVGSGNPWSWSRQWQQRHTFCQK